MSSVVINGDTSGAITLQAPSVAGTTTLTLPATTGTVTVMPSGYTLGAGNTSSFKNRIINGDMRMDQRNAGASVTPTNASYTLDRWRAYLTQSSKYTVQQNAGSVTPPAGFTNYLGVTSSSAYSVISSDYFIIAQGLEGLNVADLGWGTANAKTVTLSFWVRSSLTGTFGGALGNNAADRSYPFTYTISSANTWTQVSVTIAGDTTGTWLTNTSAGIWLYFGLGVGSTLSGTPGAWAGANYASATGATSVVGTNGATWYVTGVQLEVGSTATSFDYRDYGRELILCQRYYETSYDAISGGASTPVWDSYGGYGRNWLAFKVNKRTAPTVTPYSYSDGASGVFGSSAGNLPFSAGVTSVGMHVYTSSPFNGYIGFNYRATAEL